MTDLLAVLLDMRNGAVASDCNTKFNEVLKAVIDTGGKGELTIKLKMWPSKMGMGGCVVEVETEHECKLKKPELQVGVARFFVTKEGDLTRDDPNQVDMFELEQKPESKKEKK
jgi:hypothetical protein